MAGLTNLHEILGALRPRVRPGSYVFTTTPTPPDVIAHARITEDEGTTLVVDRDAADELGLAYDAEFGWITLQVHSSLESVGLTAAVTNALARVGISCNVIAGYYHDHLLVPVEDVAAAVDVLGGLE
ncbi:ACT domain-containing protein [Propioniciclava soli]|uniref:ACT domain-containing protein n=1 Tax=Propioniciclava soli TaxID=2775081 RepID=A0ABZ3C7W0_9ACTN|nr:ACT domain-containing protein [Propioniciclava soli]